MYDAPLSRSARRSYRIRAKITVRMCEQKPYQSGMTSGVVWLPVQYEHSLSLSIRVEALQNWIVRTSAEKKPDSYLSSLPLLSAASVVFFPHYFLFFCWAFIGVVRRSGIMCFYLCVKTVFAYFPCGIFYSKRKWGTCLYTSCLCMYVCMIMADDFSLGSVGFKSLQSWDDRLGYGNKSHSQLKLENSQGQPCYDMFSSRRWWCEHSYEALNPILALLIWQSR